jgi:hypothetical protein
MTAIIEPQKVESATIGFILNTIATSKKALSPESKESIIRSYCEKSARKSVKLPATHFRKYRSFIYA